MTALSEESFEDDREAVDAIVATGQQMISADQFLDQAEAAMYRGCDPIEELGGTTCLRKN